MNMRQKIQSLKKRIPPVDAEEIHHNAYKAEGQKVLEYCEKSFGELPVTLWNMWHSMWSGEIDGLDLTEEEKLRLVHYDSWDIYGNPPKLHPTDARRRRESALPIFWDTVLRCIYTPSNEAPSTPRFHFSDGVLFRDYVDAALVLKESTSEYNLMAVAMGKPPNTRIDGATEGIDRKEFRKLRDDADRLNKKISPKFKIQSFFQWNFGDNTISISN